MEGIRPLNKVQGGVIAFALILAGTATLAVTAPAIEQSHPLSEIIVNQNLNMNGRDITNADDVQVNTINGQTLAEIGGGASVVDGGGQDGDMTTYTGTLGGQVVMPDTFTIDAGDVVDVSPRMAAIFATEKIVINGTLDAKGLGATCCASGGFDNNGEGRPGHTVGGGGSGGDGGASPSNSQSYIGGPGGGRIYSDSDMKFLSIFYSSQWNNIFNLNLKGGASGGRGGNGRYTGGVGGDGGNGGGAVVLVAPEIVIGSAGTIDVRGNDGEDGTDGSCPDSNDEAGGGGGGGGGSGGTLITAGNSITVDGNVLLSGGSGGSGGDGCGGQPDGQSGSGGGGGRHIHFDLS